MTEKAVTEKRLREMGGCGLFQGLLVTALYSTNLPSSWTMYLMAFGGYDPGWTCKAEPAQNLTIPQAEFNHNASGLINWTDAERRPGKCSDLSTCVDIRFNGDASTIVTEWGLICDKDWIPSLIISLQMFGGLIGAFFGGHLGDRIGRKKVLYGTVLLNVIANIIAAFSTSWKMFAVIRFFNGLVVVGTFSALSPYPYEFVNSKGRACIGSIPDWNMCTAAFAICAYTFQDWRNIHLATAAVGFLVFLPVFWVPESLRWLAARGKIPEAEGVVKLMCKTNRKPVPNLSFLTEIAEEERKQQGELTTYTLLSLLHRTLRKKTVIFCLQNGVLAMSTYALKFGVKSLSGNLYLNLFLFSAPIMVTMWVLFPMTHLLGRKRTYLMFLTLTFLLATSLVIAYFTAPAGTRETAVTVLALLTTISIDFSWTTSIVFLMESFPTVVRTLAYSAALMTGRIGSIICPYLIPKDFNSLYVSFSVVGGLIVFCFVSTLFLEETKDLALMDSLARVDGGQGPKVMNDVNNHEEENQNIKKQETPDITDKEAAL